MEVEVVLTNDHRNDHRVLSDLSECEPERTGIRIAFESGGNGGDAVHIVLLLAWDIKR